MASHIDDTIEFVNNLSSVTLDEEGIAVRFDVTSLFPSVATSYGLVFLFTVLNDDDDLLNKTLRTLSENITGEELCPINSNFSFEDEICKPTDVVAMKSPVSLIVANFFCSL